jgi:glycosidase
VAATDLTDLLRRYFPFGFQTSGDSWSRFGVRGLLAHAEPFADENVRYTVRRLTEVYNKRPPSRRYPATAVHAEQLIGLGILNDALRYVLLHYALRQCPGILRTGADRVRERIGEEAVDHLPRTFAALFPPRSVLTDTEDLGQWLAAGEPELSPLERVTAEAVLLYIMTRNPATRAFRELFDDDELQRQASYVPFVVNLEEFLEDADPSGLSGESIFRTLRAPIMASPDDLAGQLAFIRAHWGALLPDSMLTRLDLARDLMHEMDLARAPEYGPPPVLDFRDDAWLYAEPAAFSRDADWMSNVVLMAKTTYVWLDQLSRRYGRRIATLADIPDRELDQLAAWGFTGLWLIGLWERSTASKKIKQFAGNPDAVASAYSLHDYHIAADLGGEDAYRDLKERAARRGIRLASDMVPNHMGIDSRWVVEHPHWFLQADRPPYPGYAFTGGDLCDDPHVEVRIEEGYWNRTDAAVVFERRDNRTGDARYIYHGNDGTSMPWNDTAQLDFTNGEVREAVIQTILHVARKFPIIRFDAAMTLARKHYQRLWFPAPGDAGAIPSRAEYGMGREQFAERMPVEFWREVVDRVAAEVPDTLLLAEAFWLMEGYFVRTLGMHRVYNSAFMNMLKMEENAKYRQTIRNVLEFSPAVLQRFVNFMNNPDERTAVEQFGKGDKYYGVAVMLVTMPGLPMVGHGQVEGFAEKYGMEYKRAYWDEAIDEDMVRRHERDVFPLMRRRALFSGAENFSLFDFVTPDGHVDENVFAYTNRHGDERALIIFNNAYRHTDGRIHTSCAINVAAPDADPWLVRRSLAEALALDGSPGVFYAFRDFASGMEYLRRGEDLANGGLSAHLHGYQYQTFLDWREIRDHDGRWRALHDRLQGRPAPSLRRAMREMELQPLLVLLSEVNTSDCLQDLAAGEVTDLAARWRELLQEAHRIGAGEPAGAPPADILAAELARVAAAGGDPIAEESCPDDDGALEDMASKDPAEAPAALRAPVAAWLAWQWRQLAAGLGSLVPAEPGSEERAPAYDRYRLTDDDLDILSGVLAGGVTALDDGVADAAAVVAAAEILVRHDDLLAPSPGRALRRLFADDAARAFLQANRHEGVWYFGKERFELLLATAREALPAVVAVDGSDAPSPANALRLATLAGEAGYRQEVMLERLGGASAESATSQEDDGTVS